MQCQHCYTEIKYIVEDDVESYINSRASRNSYFEDDLYCLWPREDILHTPLPLARIDEVIFHGGPRTD